MGDVELLDEACSHRARKINMRESATRDPVLHAGVSVMMAISLGIGAMMVTRPADLGSITIVAIALLVGLAGALLI